MKQLAVSIILFSAALTSISQDSTEKTRDLGISITRFSFENIPLDLIYKWGHDDQFWRLEAASIRGSVDFPNRNLVEEVNFSEEEYWLNLGINLAREKRISIKEKFTVYHGPFIGLSGSFSYEDYLNNYSSNNFSSANRNEELNYAITSRLGYSVGCIFHLNQNLYLSFQLAPSAYYRYGFRRDIRYDFETNEEEMEEKNSRHVTGLNFTQGAARFGLFYTFTK